MSIAKLSDDVKKKIREMHLEGVSDYRIMKDLGVSWSSVMKYGRNEEDKEWEERFSAEWDAAREAIKNGIQKG